MADPQNDDDLIRLALRRAANYFVGRDAMNAEVHLAPVRWSPITELVRTASVRYEEARAADQMREAAKGLPPLEEIRAASARRVEAAGRVDDRVLREERVVPEGAAPERDLMAERIEAEAAEKRGLAKLASATAMEGVSLALGNREATAALLRDLLAALRALQAPARLTDDQTATVLETATMVLLRRCAEPMHDHGDGCPDPDCPETAPARRVDKGDPAEERVVHREERDAAADADAYFAGGPHPPSIELRVCFLDGWRHGAVWASGDAAERGWIEEGVHIEGGYCGPDDSMPPKVLLVSPHEAIRLVELREALRDYVLSGTLHTAFAERMVAFLSELAARNYQPVAFERERALSPADEASLDTVREALGLLDSMVRSGERHSSQSDALVQRARRYLARFAAEPSDLEVRAARWIGEAAAVLKHARFPALGRPGESIDTLEALNETRLRLLREADRWPDEPDWDEEVAAGPPEPEEAPLDLRPGVRAATPPQKRLLYVLLGEGALSQEEDGPIDVEGLTVGAASRLIDVGRKRRAARATPMGYSDGRVDKAPEGEEQSGQVEFAAWWREQGPTLAAGSRRDAAQAAWMSSKLSGVRSPGWLEELRRGQVADVTLAASMGCYAALATDLPLGEAAHRLGIEARTLKGDAFETAFEWAREKAAECLPQTATLDAVRAFVRAARPDDPPATGAVVVVTETCLDCNGRGCVRCDGGGKIASAGCADCATPSEPNGTCHRCGRKWGACRVFAESDARRSRAEAATRKGCGKPWCKPEAGEPCGDCREAQEKMAEATGTKPEEWTAERGTGGPAFEDGSPGFEVTEEGGEA